MTHPGNGAGRQSTIRTFLIADIRGYTRFTDQYGDEAASRLATTFAQIVAEAMEAWDGQLVELRGDEALCTFDSPRASLRCAIELRQTFAEEADATPDVPLHVGMGLDVGEAVPVGDGYRGAALNLAARLCAGAGPGEIRATQNLAHVAGPIPGIVYEPQGTEQLKGVAAEVAVVRVAPAAEDASTPLPRAARPDGRSPAPMPGEFESAVPLVGRRDDLLWLGWHWRRARLGHGGVVDVIGPDGIGKTRLVSELARLAHADGAVVRLVPDPASLETDDGGRPWPVLAVLEDLDLAPASVLETLAERETAVAGRAILLVVTRRGQDGDVRRPTRVLASMTEADVAAIAALYASDDAEPAPTRRILEESGGLPMAVHRLASQWAQTAAMHRMGESARRTSRERRGLREAEEDLIGRYADLELTRERTRRFGTHAEGGTGSSEGPNVCPYKGLAAYEAADAEYYFGREQLIGELVARVVGSAFVGLVGASGSGKSSVLSAGLMPALANGVLPGSSDWVQVWIRPGTRPMLRLAEALRRVMPTSAPRDAEAERLLEDMTERMGQGQRLLVVIDQFEEALTADESERERFINLITEGHASVKVVLAVRADRYESCALYPRLARLLTADQVLVGPLRTEEIASIARHPAERVGLGVEPELVEALISDLGTEPGAMPLLSTALLELWEAREDGRLTLAAYRATGGVQGAVARLAESAYARLDAEEQATARSLFMRLVGEGSEPESIVRRRLPMAELDTIGDPRLRNVVEKLTVGRLLTRDEATVEVAHEALIREWPRLREWIEADAAGRQVRLHLIETARDWDGGGRGDEDLYRGARLAAALEWSTGHESELNKVERDFLRASRSSAEEAAGRQRRTNRILRGLLAGAGVLLLVAAGAGTVAWVQAQQNAANATSAQVRELSLSGLALAADDPELGLLLAAEAIRLSQLAGQTPPPQALQALWSAYVAGKSTIVIPGVGSRAVAYRPDGTQLVVDSPEREDALVTIRDPQTGDEVGAVPGSGEPDSDVEGIAFSPDGRWLAVATSGPPGAGRGGVEVFDAATLELINRLAGGHDGYLNVTLADSGLVAAFGIRDGSRSVNAMVWDLTNGSERAVLDEPPGDVTESSDGIIVSQYAGGLRRGWEQLIVGAAYGADLTDTSVIAVDLAGGVVRCPCPVVRPAFSIRTELAPDVVAPGPEGNAIAIADVGRGRVTVIDPLLGVPVFEPVAYQGAQGITWSADGTVLAVSGGESGVVVLDAIRGHQLLILPNRGEPVLSAAFRPGTDEIAVVAVSGELRIHRMTPSGGDLTSPDGPPMDVGVTDDHVVISLAQAGVAVHDRVSGARLYLRDFAVDNLIHGQVAKHAGEVAGANMNGSTSLIDVASRRESGRLPGCLAPTGTAPDATYIVFDGGPGVGGVSCVDAGATSGIFESSSATMVIEYPAERLRHGAVSLPVGEGGPRFAAVSLYDASGAGRLEVWEVDPPNLLTVIGEAESPGFAPAYVSFSSDARYLAIGTRGPRAIVLDVAALALGADVDDAIVFDRPVHTTRAPKAIVTDDGLLATASGDGVYRFWDLATGVMTFQLEAAGVLGSGMFDFSPDFETFYYEDGTGIIRRMPVNVDEMIELATSSIARSLTDAECREYLHIDGCVAR